MWLIHLHVRIYVSAKQKNYDALAVTDHFDGKVYETMIDWASKEPLNGITLDVNPNRFRNENKVKL
ncbi:hypothetical protein RhiirA4_404220 [Rhizophagus irregularis]|uniref:Uncharacterized protein n=1 Tax=Rhizophagus irregularis TaxID=588596 RepID=A0A2I1GNL3_9GLOM|nr:hypothetical protein RhiirA4_404220 [Rhizophagus irregularis]